MFIFVTRVTNRETSGGFQGVEVQSANVCKGCPPQKYFQKSFWRPRQRTNSVIHKPVYARLWSAHHCLTARFTACRIGLQCLCGRCERSQIRSTVRLILRRDFFVMVLFGVIAFRRSRPLPGRPSSWSKCR